MLCFELLSPSQCRSVETTLLKYKLIKLQLTSFLRAVKLGHPGYQLNYTRLLEMGEVSSCTSTDVKLVKCGWMNGRCKESVSFHLYRPAEKGGERGKKGRLCCVCSIGARAYRRKTKAAAAAAAAAVAVVSQSVDPHRRRG
jgi:hypothetical protein